MHEVIGFPELSKLPGIYILGNIDKGLTARTLDGKPLKLAVVDEEGTILLSGAEVAAEAWNVTVATFKNFLIGNGHLTIGGYRENLLLKRYRSEHSRNLKK